jgi:hypothetical protein
MSTRNSKQIFILLVYVHNNRTKVDSIDEFMNENKVL